MTVIYSQLEFDTPPVRHSARSEAAVVPVVNDPTERLQRVPATALPKRPADPASAERDDFTYDSAGIQISSCLESGVPLPTRVRQLSRTDVLLLTDRPLRFGTRLRLAMYVDLLASASNAGVVHWCRPGTDGWELGAFLTSPLADHLLLRARGGLRNQIRYETNWRAWVRWEGTEVRRPVQILDYSVSGLRLSCDGTVTGEQMFWLYQNSAPSSGPLLEGRVKWFLEHQHKTIVGCYVSNERARCLPRTFNQGARLHVEIPDIGASGALDPLMPIATDDSVDNRTA
ncbi:MAG: hypothetical protein R3C19_11200 [Planctomycetaceae bacterium]